MRFLVADIRNTGRVEANVTVDPQTVLGTPPEFVFFKNPMSLSANAALTGSDIVVSGKISTVITYVCGRCLEEFKKPYRAEFQSVVDASNIDLREIDVSPDIKEVVMVDLPLIPTCKEDCKGLCPTCGKNRNIIQCLCVQKIENPKWDALKEFRFNKK